MKQVTFRAQLRLECLRIAAMREGRADDVSLVEQARILEAYCFEGPPGPSKTEPEAAENAAAGTDPETAG